eukprot:jgi/Tetstr1/432027/TSEL_021501.t1
MAAGGDAVEVPVCLMVPLLGPPPAEGSAIPNPSGLHLLRGLLRAVHHVNSADCSVLGEGCSELLHYGASGRRLRLRPYLFNIESGVPQSAPKSALSCAATDAEVIVGPLTSEESSTIASFVGGLGRLLVSSVASSPAFSRQDAYPNFARTTSNHAVNAVAAVHLVQEFGWQKVALLHKADLYGLEMAEAFSDEAAKLNINILTISLGLTVSETEVERAMRELVRSGVKVVVSVATPTDFVPVLTTARRVITEAGQDYSSFNWISSSMNIESVLKSIAISGEESDESLLEGLLTLALHYPESGFAKLEESLQEETPEGLLADIEEYMSASGTWTNGTPANVNPAIFGAVLARVEAVGVSEFMIDTYDAVWAVAAGIAAAARATEGTAPVSGADVTALMTSGSFPTFQGAGGQRGFLRNGDWNMSSTHFDVQNYATRPGTTERQIVEVARIDPETYEVLFDGPPVVWANGRVYPYVPSDGTTKGSLLLISIVTAVLIVPLMLLLGYLIVRNLHLSRRVENMQDRATGASLESPATMMLNFLQKSQLDDKRKRPSKAAARRLEEMIVSHSAALTVPDLGGLQEDYSSGIGEFLLDATRHRTPSTTVAGRQLSISPATSSSNLGGWGPSSWEISPTADATSDHEPELDDPLSARRRVRQHIGREFFLDLISPESPFLDCETPIQLVVKQCMKSGNLLPGNRLLCLMRFTKRIEEGYPNGCYHCKSHGADVTNRLMVMMRHAGLVGARFTPNAKNSQRIGVVAMVAAMIHDYRHLQVNNAFLIESEHELALEFNGKAVAEHYAVREAMRLLMEPECNFLRRSEEDDGTSEPAVERRKAFRNIIVQLVLATDMASHFDLVSQFEVQLVRNEELRALRGDPQAMWAAMSDEQRLLALKIALKVADIGHCALPMSTHLAWAQRLEEEYFAQGDREKRAGWTISPLMDRRKPGPMDTRNQVGFFKVIVLPLFKAWTDMFPTSAPLLQQVEANLQEYERKMGVRHSVTAVDSPQNSRSGSGSGGSPLRKGKHGFSSSGRVRELGSSAAQGP